MGKYEIKLFKERMAIHKKLAEGKSLTRDEEETLLDEKIQNHRSEFQRFSTFD